MKRKIIQLAFLLLMANNHLSSQVLPQDSIILREIFFNMDGPNWSISTNWINGPVSSWVGVVISGGRVTKLFLNNFGLNGAIPSSIGDLDSLDYLDFGDNFNITGNIPPEIGNLTKLTYLSIDHSKLSGNIPQEIGNLTKLTSLTFGYNQLSGTIPPSLGNLTELSALQLHSNNLSGSVPDSIKFLDKLLYLHLWNNQLEYLPDLSNINTIDWLQIQNNKFTFEDIEPNILVASLIFNYSPQDSVNESMDTIVTEGSSLIMVTSVGGTANQYQWTFNGADIPGATDSVLQLDSISANDTGNYSCRITNTIAFSLTLYRKVIKVSLDSPSRVNLKKISISDINLYPNPAPEYINIDFTDYLTSLYKIKIYNNMGMLIDDFFGTGDFQLDISNYSIGTYIIIVNLEDRMIINKFTHIEQ